MAERNKRAGHLRVDQGPVESKTSPGKAQGLNIHTHMYLGGVPNMDILPKPANVSEMFEGCIGEVRSLRSKKKLNHKRSKRQLKNCLHLPLRFPSTTRKWICPTASQRADLSASVWTTAPVTAGPASMVVTACQMLNMSTSVSAGMDLKVSSRAQSLLNTEHVPDVVRIPGNTY